MLLLLLPLELECAWPVSIVCWFLLFSFSNQTTTPFSDRLLRSFLDFVYLIIISSFLGILLPQDIKKKRFTISFSLSSLAEMLIPFKLRCQFIVSPDIRFSPGVGGQRNNKNSLHMKWNSFLSFFHSFILLSLSFSLFSQETHERNKPPMGLIYSRWESILCSGILFYFIILLKKKKRKC